MSAPTIKIVNSEQIIQIIDPDDDYGVKSAT